MSVKGRPKGLVKMTSSGAWERKDWPWLLITVFLSVQAVAAFLYGWTNPELTEMQVLQAIGKWSIPARWM